MREPYGILILALGLTACAPTESRVECSPPSTPWPCAELESLTFESGLTTDGGTVCRGPGSVRAAASREENVYLPGFAFEPGYVYGLDVGYALFDESGRPLSGLSEYGGLDRGFRYTFSPGTYRLDVRINNGDGSPVCSGSIAITAF